MLKLCIYYFYLILNCLKHNNTMKNLSKTAGVDIIATGLSMVSAASVEHENNAKQNIIENLKLINRLQLVCPIG